MFQRLLVPLDGTDTAIAALPTASTLAQALSAEVALLRVVPPIALARDRSAKRSEALAGLDEDGRKLALTGVAVSTQVRSGNVVRSILREIEDHQIDLVVMATRGHHGLTRAILGSTASALLARSPVPVVLQRAAGKDLRTVSRFLVAVDDSEGAALALAAATRLAHATGAKLVLLRVAEPIPLWTYDAQAGSFYLGSHIDPAWDAEVLASAQRQVDGLAERLRGLGVAAESRAVLGPVAETIVRTGDEVDADLVVMSTRGRTGPTRALLGSVADAVARTAERPALLVPFAPARAEALERRAGPLAETSVDLKTLS